MNLVVTTDALVSSVAKTDGVVYSIRQSNSQAACSSEEPGWSYLTEPNATYAKIRIGSLTFNKWFRRMRGFRQKQKKKKKN